MRAQRTRPGRWAVSLVAGPALLTAALLTPEAAGAALDRPAGPLLGAAITAGPARATPSSTETASYLRSFGLRTNQVRAAVDQVAGVSLSAGQLSYIDTGVSAVDERGSVWQRPVSREPDGRLLLGAPTRSLAISVSTGPQAIARSRSVLSASAGRSVVEQLAATANTVLPYDLVDRGVITNAFTFIGRAGFRLRASGPYAIVERRVYRADGTKVLDLSESAVHTDLYGSTVIYSRADGSVRVRDLAQETSDTNPRLLAKAHCDAGCAGPVAAWGTTVAWARQDGALLVRTLPAARVRVVKPITGVFDLRLSEGALSWHTASGTMRVVNLRAAKSSAQVVGMRGAEVDDHLIAGISSTGALAVRALPFGQSTHYRPRLIGLLPDPGFSADGDGTDDLWAPRFDLSKPVGTVTLKLSRAGAVVRTLTGSAADGSVRNLSWDGKDDLGLLAPAGTYSWRLTGTASDGEGTLTAVNGRNTAAGTVTLTR